MGVDCKLYLPSDVRLRDVADVTAILLGCKVEKKPLDGGSYHADISGVSFTSYSACPEMTSINISLPEADKDGETGRSFYFHYESDAHPGMRLMTARSRGKTIALFVRLAKFFGGIIDINDCDSEDEDFKFKRGPHNRACDGKAWERLQDAKLNLKPLSKDELERYQGMGAYDHEHR